MGKLNRIRRNDPNTVSFKLVAADQSDPRVENSDKPIYIFQRTDVNRNKKAIPDDLIRVMTPEDFGIHSNLSAAQKSRLCREVFGSSSLPQGCKEIQASSSTVVPNGEMSEFLIDAVEELEDSEGNFADDDVPFLLDDNELNSKTSIEHQAFAGEDLYFPDDGYNYEQHLRTVGCTPGATFIEYKSSQPVTGVSSSWHTAGQVKGIKQKNENLPEEFFTAEGKEVFKVLADAEEKDEDVFDGELPDDFVSQAQNCSKAVYENILWGPGHLNVSKHLVPTDEDSKFARTMELYGENDIGCLSSDGEAYEEANSVGEYKCRVGKEKEHISKIDDETEKLAKTVTRRLLAESNTNEEDDTKDTLFSDSETESEVSWDCESILTTRSTLFNHPSTINRPVAVAPKSIKIPFDKLPRELTALALQKLGERKKEIKKRGQPTEIASGNSGDTADIKQSAENREDGEDGEEDTVTLAAVDLLRRKGETLEEKRARKKAFREVKSQIRGIRKEMKEEFKKCAKNEATKISNKNAYDIREGVRRIRVT